MNEQTMPATFTVSEIRGILKIGSNSVYNLIHSKSFPVRRIGRSYRIPCESFLLWLTGNYPELAVKLTSKPKI